MLIVVIDMIQFIIFYAIDLLPPPQWRYFDQTLFEKAWVLSWNWNNFLFGLFGLIGPKNFLVSDNMAKKLGQYKPHSPHQLCIYLC